MLLKVLVILLNVYTFFILHFFEILVYTFFTDAGFPDFYFFLFDFLFFIMQALAISSNNPRVFF